MRNFSIRAIHERASVRTPLLMSIVFLAGIGVGVVGDRALRKPTSQFAAEPPEISAGAVEDTLDPVERRTSTAPGLSPLPTSAVDAKNAAEKVRLTFPNLDSLSLADAKRILRERAMNEFKAANQEMELKVKNAQRRLEAAQSGGNEEEQQAAMRQLQTLQEAQAERLKDIGIDLQEQNSALDRLKAGAN